MADETQGPGLMPDGTPEPPIDHSENPVVQMPAISKQDIEKAQGERSTTAAGATEPIANLATVASSAATTEEINLAISEAAKAAAIAAGVSTRTAPDGAALSERPVPSPVVKGAGDGTTTLIMPPSNTEPNK